MERLHMKQVSIIITALNLMAYLRVLRQERPMPLNQWVVIMVKMLWAGLQVWLRLVSQQRQSKKDIKLVKICQTQMYGMDQGENKNCEEGFMTQLIRLTITERTILLARSLFSMLPDELH